MKIKEELKQEFNEFEEPEVNRDKKLEVEYEDEPLAILEELEGVPEVKEESEEKELKEVELSPEGETAAEEIKNEPEEGEPAKELAKSSSWTCFLCEIQ